MATHTLRRHIDKYSLKSNANSLSYTQGSK